MKLNNLIDIYLSYRNQAHIFTREQGIGQTEIDDSICNLLTKLKEGSEITSQEFNQFSEKVNLLEKNKKDCIIYIAFNIAENIYKRHKAEIKMTVDVIEKNANKSHQIPQETPNAEKYIDLINAYLLFVYTQNEMNLNNIYPGVTSYSYDKLASGIPFSINALTLTGKLPKGNYNGVNTAKGLYPLDLVITKENKLPHKKGIKVSDDYFPYKAVSKIAKRNTGNRIFLATNGSKFIFIRDVKYYSPQGILASKIATLVKPEYFSSERLMDNKVVASRGINTYACCVADWNTRNARKQYIETDKKVFPGTGIIDEVTNYVIETDLNIGKLGFSSTKIEEAHLSKIDFDRCFLSSPASKETYERDIVSGPWDGIYHALEHVQKDPSYIHEKLYARLKLSMITEPLLRSLADKAFIDKDQQDKEKSITECSKRSDIALELFWEHKEAKQFIIDNPKILNQCDVEIIHYIKEHFEEKDQPKLLNSLRERVEFISSKLTEKLGVNPQILEVRSLEKEEQPHKLEERIATPDKYSYYLEDNNNAKKMDYYEILQISKYADAGAIKKQMRKLAREFHPDRNESSERSKLCFQMIYKAFVFLSNPGKHEPYEKYGIDTNFTFDVNFPNFNDLSEFLKFGLSPLDELSERLDELESTQSTPTGEIVRANDLEKIALALQELWAGGGQYVDVINKQFALFKRVSQQAQTADEFYALYLIAQKDRWMAQSGTAHHYMQKAAANGHILALSAVTVRAFSGHFRPLEDSLRWALNSLRYLEETVVPKLEKEKPNSDILKTIKKELAELRKHRNEILPLTISRDPLEFNKLVAEVVEYRKKRGGDSFDDFRLSKDMIEQLEKNLPLPQAKHKEEQRPLEKQHNAEQVINTFVVQINKFDVDFSSITTVELVQKQQKELLKKLADITRNQVQLTQALNTLNIQGQSPKIKDAIVKKTEEINLAAQQKKIEVRQQEEEEHRIKQLAEKLGPQKEQYNELLKNLSTVISEYGKENDTVALNLTKEFAEGEKFFDRPTPENFEVFRKVCKDAIKEASVEFKKDSDFWNSIHPILKGILGVLAALAVIPAIVVAATTKEGYVGTFFKTAEPAFSEVETNFEKVAEDIQQLITPRRS